MSFCWSVNNFVFHSVKHIRFCAKESVFVGSFTGLLYSKEFFLRLIATMLCWKQHVEIGLDASEIMILMLKVKNALTLAVWIFETKLVDFYRSGFLDYLHLYCYIHNVLANMSSGLLQVFIELGSLHRAWKHILYLIGGGHLLLFH